MLYAMEPVESDWYTQAGFWLSLAGVAVSAIGLGATYYQVRKARKSADAARDAAEATRRDSHDGFRRYFGATIHRQLAEVLRGFVFENNWALAKLRCEDIAAIFAQLSEADSPTDYRRFATLFRDKISKPNKKFVRQTWDELIAQSNRKIDQLLNSFA